MNIEDKNFRLTVANLDETSLQLPALYSHWYYKEAVAKSERDNLKDRVEVMKAEADLGYRSMSLTSINEDFGFSLKSLTEGAFKALVQSDPEVKKATDEYHKANRDYNICMAKRRSLEQTKDLVEMKARLWLKGFYYDGVIKDNAEPPPPKRSRTKPKTERKLKHA